MGGIILCHERQNTLKNDKICLDAKGLFMVFVKLLKDTSTKSLQNKINRYTQHLPKDDIVSISINSFDKHEFIAPVVTNEEPPKQSEESKPDLKSKGKGRKHKIKK